MRDRATAVLAWVEHDVPDPPSVCLVCHLGLSEIETTLCTARSGLVSLIDSETVQPQGDVDARLANPAAHRPSVLRNAMRSERYRDAGVYEDGDGWVRAGDLIDTFTPYGALACSATVRLLGRHSNLDPSELGYVLVGELAPFPLAADALALALPSGCRTLAAGMPGIDVLMRGTELIASGAKHFPDTYPYTLAVRTREIRGGRLLNGRVVVAPAHALDSSGEAVFGESGARPTPVAVGTNGEGSLEFDLLMDAGESQPLGCCDVGDLQPGSYVIGVRLVGGYAELVFRPEGGGASHAVVVGPLPAAGARSRRVPPSVSHTRAPISPAQPVASATST